MWALLYFLNIVSHRRETLKKLLAVCYFEKHLAKLIFHCKALKQIFALQLKEVKQSLFPLGFIVLNLA